MEYRRDPTADTFDTATCWDRRGDQPTPSRPRGGPHAQVAAARRGLPGDVHALGGRHHRHRRPARHGPEPGHHVRRPAVGHGRLRPGPGRAPAGRRLTRRPRRTPPALRRRPRGLRRRLAGLRPGRQPRRAHRLPRRAGRRRRGDAGHHRGADQPSVLRARPGHGLRRLGRGQRRRGRDRADPGRAAHPAPGLALDLLRQPADQRGGGRDDPALRGRVPCQAPAGPGPAGPADLHRRGRTGDVRADQGQRLRLGLDAHGRSVRRGGGGAGRLRRRRAPAGRRCWTWACSGAGRSPA
ncbi:hypothetical protein ABH926_007414 [Catenulispora sp. GP43]